MIWTHCSKSAWLAIVNNELLHEISSDLTDPTPISHAYLMLLKYHANLSPLDSLTRSDLSSYGKLRWRSVQQIAEERKKDQRKNIFLLTKNPEVLSRRQRNLTVKFLSSGVWSPSKIQTFYFNKLR